MVYTIRSAEEKDLSEIYNFVCSLETVKFDFADFGDIFKSNISNTNNYYLIAETDDELIGYISCHLQYLLHHCGKVAEIQELFVTEKYRKSEIGKALVKHLEKKLEQDKCLSVEVTAQNKRTQTHQFYERLGFNNSHHKFTKLI